MARIRQERVLIAVACEGENCHKRQEVDVTDFPNDEDGKVRAQLTEQKWESIGTADYCPDCAEYLRTKAEENRLGPLYHHVYRPNSTFSARFNPDRCAYDVHDPDTWRGHQCHRNPKVRIRGLGFCRQHAGQFPYEEAEEV